jgi:hypothetical protein
MYVKVSKDQSEMNEISSEFLNIEAKRTKFIQNCKRSKRNEPEREKR